MSVSAIALLAFIAIALLYGIVIYNNLVRLKHAIAKAWANIDVLLKQRHDELPKLVEVCRQYKQFEETTLTRVIEARARVSSARADHDVPALGAAEGMLRMGLGQLFAVAEAYPELKANEHFMQLQTRITALARHNARGWDNPAIPDDLDAIGRLLHINRDQLIRHLAIPEEDAARLLPEDTDPPA